jgi:hypothetical protein
MYDRMSTEKKVADEKLLFGAGNVIKSASFMLRDLIVVWSIATVARFAKEHSNLKCATSTVDILNHAAAGILAPSRCHSIIIHQWYGMVT